jgi:predicted molibdopterin-dependent oxidoreductase YjgC
VDIALTVQRPSFCRSPAQLLYNLSMTAPATLFRPFSRLVRLTLLGYSFEVPENNSLLRCLQFLAPEQVSYGRFCWNEECQHCRVTFDLGEGTAQRIGLACKVNVEEGMRVSTVTTEIKYCLRSLDLK